MDQPIPIYKCPYCDAEFNSAPLPVHDIHWPDCDLPCTGSGAILDPIGMITPYGGTYNPCTTQR
jgi:hypothetical protein